MPVEVQSSTEEAPPLPGLMANLSPERRAALIARQQNERTVQERAQQQLSGAVGVFSKIIWFLAFRAACTATFAVLLYRKLGLGSYFSASNMGISNNLHYHPFMSCHVRC
jgi:hypothetical protein